MKHTLNPIKPTWQTLRHLPLAIYRSCFGWVLLVTWLYLQIDNIYISGTVVYSKLDKCMYKSLEFQQHNLIGWCGNFISPVLGFLITNPLSFTHHTFTDLYKNKAWWQLSTYCIVVWWRSLAHDTINCKHSIVHSWRVQLLSQYHSGSVPCCTSLSRLSWLWYRFM